LLEEKLIKTFCILLNKFSGRVLYLLFSQHISCP